jgi:hypothetical protein
LRKGLHCRSALFPLTKFDFFVIALPYFFELADETAAEKNSRLLPRGRIRGVARMNAGTCVSHTCKIIPDIASLIRAALAEKSSVLAVKLITKSQERSAVLTLQRVPLSLCSHS